MSKKQILKNIQKDRKTTSDKEAKDNYFKFITTLAILLIVFISAYFAIGFFYTKEISFNKEEEIEDEINIDNNTIMLGQMFDQSDDEYYVLIYDMSDEDSIISTWESSYASGDDALKMYKVDSSKKFNAKYIVKKDSNKSASDLSNLKVVSPTLIKVANKQIAEYIEGEDDIVNILKGN